MNVAGEGRDARRFLVTGGAGFIGSNFVKYLLARPQVEAVYVLDNLTYAGRLENLEACSNDSRYRFGRADLAVRGEVEAFLEDADFDCVVHMAAESHVDRSISDPGPFFYSNVIGTYNLLEALRRSAWVDTERRNLFVHVSTDEVFGSLGPEGFFHAESPYKPNSPYAASKAASDHVVRSYYETFGFPALITNCTNNFGPNQLPEKLIPLVIVRCLRGQPIPVYGTGENVRDWIFVTDHCAAIEAAIERGKPGMSYLLGGGNQWRNIDLIEVICSLMDKLHPSGAPHRRLISFVKDRAGHDFRYAIDSGTAREQLGWDSGRDFADRLEETVLWYIQNPEWWSAILPE